MEEITRGNEIGKRKKKICAKNVTNTACLPKLCMQSASEALAAFLYAGGEISALTIDGAISNQTSITDEQLQDEIVSKADNLENDEKEGLVWLLDVEHQVCESLGVKTFELLGRGSFIQFLNLRIGPQEFIEKRFSAYNKEANEDLSGTDMYSNHSIMNVSQADIEAAVKRALIVTDDCNATPLTCLYNLERRVCMHFKVDAFVLLGNGASFLSFLAEHADLTLRAAFSSLQQGVSPREVIQAAVKLSLMEYADVERTLCRAFEVNNVASLGCGRIDEIMTQVNTNHAAAPVEASSVANIGLLSPQYLTNLHQGHKDLDFTSREFTIKCIVLCPYLVEIEAHLHWQFCFYPHHGALKEFCTSIRPSEYSGGALLQFIQPRHDGVLFKVDRRPSNDKFSAALEAWDAVKAAEQLVALLVSAGSIGSMSTNVLQTYAKHVIKISVTSIDTGVLMSEDNNVSWCHGGMDGA